MKSEFKKKQQAATTESQKQAAWRRLWEEIHCQPPPIDHPIPKLTVPRAHLDIATRQGTGAGRSARLLIVRLRGKIAATPDRESSAPLERGPLPFKVLAWLALLTVLATGCQVLTYTGPHGERFSRSSFGSTTSISSLSVEADTNGLRRVELRGYTNDSTTALGAVTEAAVRAAIQGAK